MKLPNYNHSMRMLGAMVMLAAIYGGLMFFLHSLTGSYLFDGGLGVMLGLYICSHPAGNTVDMIFFDRGTLQRITSDRSGISWLLMNMLVLIVGWVIIVVGATRLFGNP